MLIYRVESSAGIGVYRTGFRWMFQDAGDRHPGPERDGIKDYSWSHYFGFESIRQLTQWFDTTIRQKWADHMEKHKNDQAPDILYISVYDVPASSVIKGGRQLVYIKDHARLISRKTVLDFMDVPLAA